MADTLAGFPTLTTERLVVAPLRAEDAAAVVAISDNPEILGVIHFLPSPFRVADAETLIVAKGDGQDRFLGLWSRTEGTLCGVFGVHLQADNRLEIGYWIAPERHGRGLATEAGRAVLAEVRALFAERRVIAHALPTNHRSLNVLRKLGFRPSEGAPSRPERNLLELES